MPFKSILIKDTSKKKKFWKKERSFDELIKKKFETPCKSSISGVLKKYSKKSQRFEPYSFFIVGPYFGYYNLNDMEVRYLDLTLCLTSEIKHKSSSSPQGFTLTRHNSNTKEFLVKSNAELDDWCQKLRRFCLQTNFQSHYELQRQIGKGNFSSVFKAKCKRDGQFYAAKVISTEGLAKSSKLRQAVRTELAINKNLSHPNIVQFIEAYEDEEKIYIVTEMLEGGELFERVLKRKKYPEKEAATVIKQVLEALLYLEHKGIIHRDLKLENVLLVKQEDDCYVKLADFGLSANPQSHDSKARCGTPGYIAPEIILEKPYDCKADMFSTGVMLYTLLSGCTPFPGKTFDEILAKNKKSNPKFNTSHWNNVSFEAIDFVIKLLSFDPTKRPSPAEALKSPWIKGTLEQSVPSQSNDPDTNTESIGNLGNMKKSIEYKIKQIETYDDKANTESEPATIILGLLTPKPQDSAFTKKHSLTITPDSESFARVFIKRHSLVSDQQRDQVSMHKKIMQRNLLKKLETFDPHSVGEVSESNEQSMSQSTASKFDLKSGVLLNSFYAKGGSQGITSEIDIPSARRTGGGLEVQEVGSVRRSFFGKLHSMKHDNGLPMSPSECLNRDNIPEEENAVINMIEALKSTMCFLSKPNFLQFDIDDSDLKKSKIVRFPDFKNAFTQYPRRLKRVNVPFIS